MPNVIWTSISKVQDGRATEAAARAQKLRQLALGAGAVSVRYFASNAGPTAPSNVFAMEFTGMGHMEEVFAALQADAWFQQEYLANTDQPSSQIAQSLLNEIDLG